MSDKTGDICFVNPDKNIYFDASVDGPVSYQLKDFTQNIDDGLIGLNIDKQTQMVFHKIEDSLRSKTTYSRIARFRY